MNRNQTGGYTPKMLTVGICLEQCIIFIFFAFLHLVNFQKEYVLISSLKIKL